MPRKKKSPNLKYIPAPITAYQKVLRWQACIQIAKLYYHAALSDEELGRIFLALRGKYFPKEKLNDGY